jgi:PAS domain S-box-containing protein
VGREGNHTELILLAVEDVTALREAERRRREAEARFTEMVRNVRDHSVFLTDPAGVITSWNVAAERIIGFTEAEAVGRHFSLIFTPEDIEAGVPERELRLAREEGRAEDERWHARKGGERFWALGIFTPLHDPAGQLSGFSKILRDMTGWKRAGEELAASRGRLQALFDNSLDAVLLADDGGRYVDANPAACTLLGLDRDDLLRRTVLDITPPPDAAAGRAAWDAFLRDGQQAGEYAVRRPDGTRVVVEYRAVANIQPGLHLSVLRDVTDRETLLRQVRVERERLADVFRQAPSFMCVLTGPEHVFERANDRYLQLVGHRDILGKPVRDALPEVAGQGFFELLDTVYRTGEAYTGTDVQVALVRHPGQPPEERYVDFVYQPTRDPDGTVTGVLAQGVDLTDRHRAEAEVARLAVEADRDRRLFDTALSNTTDYNFLFDLDGRVVYANRALLALWGRTAGQALGKTLAELDYPADAEAQVARNLRRVIETGEAVRDETPYTGPTAATGHFEYILAPVLEAGRVVSVAGSSRDITARKVMEDTLREQAERLREADRRKDEFLATLAHELRNPLAPIRNALQILKMPRVDAATVERSRDMMERQVQQLVRLVDDLMDVSRVMQGKIELRRERVELASVVARAVETAQPGIDAQGHRLSVALPPDSLPLEADPVRLVQVVGNLLTNAAKYTERGGHIWLTAGREGGQAVLRVRDDGIGIAPDMLPRVFDLFVQVDHAAARSQGGLGIGLTLVKNLVRMHHGAVEVHSPGLGEGSEFVVRLPLADGGREGPAGRGGDGRPADARPGSRLLVVDDNRDAADSLAEMLRLQGHEVRVANDGPAGLELLEGYRPEMVFLDIGMPKMDGYEVARRLRRVPGLEHVRLAALTGWGQPEDRRRTAEAGFDHHLVKPVEPKTLDELLGNLPAPSDRKGARP